MSTQPTVNLAEILHVDFPAARAHAIPAANGVRELDLGALVEKSTPHHDDAAARRQAAGMRGDFVRFYGLRENPFGDAVNPAYLYQTESHIAAYTRMRLAIEHDISMAMITGPSGMGKTLITQVLLQELDPLKYETALVLVSPGLSKTGLLREILCELNTAAPEGLTRTHDLLRILSDYIIDLHQSGRRLVLIVDECHLLSTDCLHLVRTISNIEIPERKLTTCVLIGEARFTARLEHPSYESLRNRMYLRAALEPMSAEECEQYVKFRLMVAGRIEAVFSSEAFAAVHSLSGGVCRNINKLCMLSLLEGALRHKDLIDAATVEAGACMM